MMPILAQPTEHNSALENCRGSSSTIRALSQSYYRHDSEFVFKVVTATLEERSRVGRYPMLW